MFIRHGQKESEADIGCSVQTTVGVGAQVISIKTLAMNGDSECGSCLSSNIVLLWGSPGLFVSMQLAHVRHTFHTLSVDVSQLQ